MRTAVSLRPTALGGAVGGAVGGAKRPKVPPFSVTPRAYWNFNTIDTTVGNKVPDLAGTYPFTITGTTGWGLGAGRIGNCLQLASGGNYNIIANPLITGATAQTLVMWVKKASTAAGYFWSQPGYWRAATVASGAGYKMTYYPGGGSAGGAPVLAVADWQLVVTIFRVTAGNLLSSCNGGAKVSILTGASVDSANLYLGSNWSSGERSTIDVDEMAHFVGELSDAQIAELYARGVALQPIM